MSISVIRRDHDPSWDTLSYEEVKAAQLQILKARLRSLLGSNGFYRDHWRRHGLEPENVETLEDFARMVPMVSKEDFLVDQESAPPYGRRLGVPHEELVQTQLTSGTTGIGQEVHGLTARDLHMAGDASRYQLTAAGLARGDLMVCLAPVTFLAVGFCQSEAYRQAELRPMFGFGVDKRLLVRLMARLGAAGMYGPPNIIAQLQQAAMEEGIDPRADMPQMKAIVTSLFVPPFSMVQEMMDFWGVPVFDTYGCTQATSSATFSCEAGVLSGERRNPSHFIAKYFYIEVVDPDTGLHVKAGEEGEIVLTTLTREASPVIRFRMRDRAVFASHANCRCGRPYDGFVPGEVGRYDDMLKVKGVNLWPRSIDEIVLTRPEVDEYRGRIVLTESSHEELLLQIALKTSLAGGEIAREELFRAIVHEVKIATLITPRVQEVSELPHFEFKPQRWTDERNQGRQRVTW